MIRIFAGYDPNEAAGYHVFCHSVLTRASEPVSITPVASNTFAWWKRTNTEDHKGATEFSFARFLVPYLCDYSGHAIFMDGSDMLCMGDVAELWAMRSHRHAVQCVKHPDYEPTKIKMWDQQNRKYHRKNWSSVMIMNCDYHHSHILTPEKVASASGAYLHQFQWTTDDRIGELPPEWNVLLGEQEIPQTSKLLHFTLGLPPVHANVVDSLWRAELRKMNPVTDFLKQEVA